jgi:hypothetical protein
VIVTLPKPAIFIASSVEGLEIAYAMQEHLEYVAEPTVWTQGVFKPSSFTLIDLVKATAKFQFAIFVFSFDDALTVRDAKMQVVRDNVIFEFGLFIGSLGLPRCFFVMPKASQPLHLPTDLLGLEPLTYAADRSDANIVAALGPAANRVRRAIRELREVPTKSVAGLGVDAAVIHRPMTAQDYIDQWNSGALADARTAVRTMPSSPYGYDDEELEAHRALRRLFTFLEGLSDAVLSGELNETAARSVFQQPVAILWPHMYTLLAPANHAEDWWRPLPRLADLYRRWGGAEGQSPS